MPLTEISAGMKVGESGLSIVGWLRAQFLRRRTERALVSEAKSHLGIEEPYTYAYRAAAMHPLFNRGAPHPDDARALAAIAAESYFRAASNGDVSEVDDLTMMLDDGMVCVGSPEADGIARLAYGYRTRSDGMGMEYVNPPVDLPFRWEEDQTHVEATYKRFVAGRGLVERPNWPIIDERNRAKRLFPRVGNDGLLQTDYLLVTKVPNYLTRVGYESGRSIITFGGSHGTGTRAVEVLMRDRSTLRQVAEALPKRAPAFQLLFEVGSIVHDSTVGSHAKALRLAATCVLDREDSVWTTARQRVEHNLSDWLSEVGASSD